jgi:hypothetical protein
MTETNESKKPRRPRAVVVCALLTALVSAACLESPDEDVAADQAELAAGCAVQGDGLLHCGNMQRARLYAQPHFSSGVVNELWTTYSWFDCWQSGQFHDGQNYTWYHTLGDAGASWGYVPAAWVYTPDWFDANPSAYGLRRCY